MRFEPGSFCTWAQHANNSATEPPIQPNTSWLFQALFTAEAISKWIFNTALLTIMRIPCHDILEQISNKFIYNTHTRLTALCPGLPGWAGTRKVKPIWILLKQETVSGSGISWAICKSASRSRQITMPAPQHSFLQADALPATQPTASKHWRPIKTFKNPQTLSINSGAYLTLSSQWPGCFFCCV